MYNSFVRRVIPLLHAVFSFDLPSVADLREARQEPVPVPDLEVPEFDSLYGKIEVRRFEEKRLDGPDRNRGSARQFQLSQDRPLLLMLHHRLYITLALTQFLFDPDPSNVRRDIRYLEPVVRKCVTIPKRVNLEPGVRVGKGVVPARLLSSRPFPRRSS